VQDHSYAILRIPKSWQAVENPNAMNLKVQELEATVAKLKAQLQEQMANPKSKRAAGA
jgi:hypothetical protein